MNTDEILHILRNPYGINFDKVREARLAAADEIEILKKEYADLKEWCEENGLDTTTTNFRMADNNPLHLTPNQ